MVKTQSKSLPYSLQRLKDFVQLLIPFNYNILPVLVHNKFDVQDYFSLTRATHTEISQVAYLEVLDAISDSKDTLILLDLLHDLQIAFYMSGLRFLISSAKCTHLHR